MHASAKPGLKPGRRQLQQVTRFTVKAADATATNCYTTSDLAFKPAVHVFTDEPSRLPTSTHL
ncbi:hypothetical protein PLUA15_40051 [Pseudomonas lundensis]|uniref:Uncharacterized protein n=1 Tax=Pseudomonas lundensis TaxID=86185 RepID=A0AAX2HBP6_9PSED|nr:hypothetical protein PLUA15_40051 [Pseudomonas lundensis]